MYITHFTFTVQHLSTTTNNKLKNWDKFIELINSYNDSLVYCLLKILISISVFDFAYYRDSYLVQNSVQTTVSNVIWKYKSCFRKFDQFSSCVIFARWQAINAHACRALIGKCSSKLQFWLTVIFNVSIKRQPDSSIGERLSPLYKHTHNSQSSPLCDQGQGNVWKVTFKNSLRRLIYLNNSRLIIKIT